MLDLLVQGGLVVSPDDIALLDVGIVDGRVVSLAAPGSSGDAARTIDATGRIVLPGGVELHAHVGQRVPLEWTSGHDVWLPGPEPVTRAAAHGGTTTVLAFALVGEGIDARHALRRVTETWKGQSHVDYAFHLTLLGTAPTPVLQRLPELLSGGVPSVKLFMTRAPFRSDPKRIVDVLRIVGRAGGIVHVHAEDDRAVEAAAARLRTAGLTETWRLSEVHSSSSEKRAFEAVIRAARDAACPVVFVHVSAASGVAAIRRARLAGQAVYGEVLHNYLCFNEADLRRPGGVRFHTYPALKTPTDRQSIWDGLADGALSVLATDEYTTSLAVKTAGETFDTAVGGHAGIETRGMIGYSEGVARGRLSLRRFVDVFASGPARLAGLYPRKGAIGAGSDADLVLWDPAASGPLRLADLHHAGDYSIWEGWPVTGRPVMTILRGVELVTQGRLIDDRRAGQWLPRRLDPALAAGPAC